MEHEVIKFTCKCKAEIKISTGLNKKLIDVKIVCPKCGQHYSFKECDK